MGDTVTHHVEQVMGTAVVFEIPSGLDADEIDRAVEFLHRVDATFSVYRDDSEISRLAGGELELDATSAEVRWVLRRCEELRVDTAGWFDHRPSAGRRRLDPSAFVKGWSIDEVVLMLRIAGIRDLSINAGGDVRVLGHAPSGEAWRVGIRHPEDALRSLATITLTDGAVATSGRYERGDHIWPASKPNSRVVSATVVGPELSTADALATAVVAADGVEAFPDLFPEYRFLVVDRSLEVRRYGWREAIPAG
jgi:thiamine biosynthesis lipoprotein